MKILKLFIFISIQNFAFSNEIRIKSNFYRYNSFHKKDPFQIIEPNTKVNNKIIDNFKDINRWKLIGIWGETGNKQAMIVSKDDQNIDLVIRKDMIIGDNKIEDIAKNHILVKNKVNLPNNTFIYKIIKLSIEDEKKPD